MITGKDNSKTIFKDLRIANISNFFKLGAAKIDGAILVVSA